MCVCVCNTRDGCGGGGPFGHDVYDASRRGVLCRFLDQITFLGARRNARKQYITFDVFIGRTYDVYIETHWTAYFMAHTHMIWGSLCIHIRVTHVHIYLDVSIYIYMIIYLYIRIACKTATNIHYTRDASSYILLCKYDTCSEKFLKRRTCDYNNNNNYYFQLLVNRHIYIVYVKCLMFIYIT